MSGIKLHIGVDTRSLPHAMFVSTVDMQDRDGAHCLIGHAYPNLSKVEKGLVDGRYTGDDFAQDMKWLINAQVEVVKRNELHTFAVLPKRWIASRTCSTVVLSPGLINAADFGKIVNVFCLLLFKWLN